MRTFQVPIPTILWLFRTLNSENFVTLTLSDFYFHCHDLNQVEWMSWQSVQALTREISDDEIEEWLLDTGASCHVTNNATNMFFCKTRMNQTIMVGSGRVG
jgi:hypothetical protein